ncbi:hypothetical protein FQA39_LY08557 [Lamprigera yunnana]|nr:hypothetical protein FQA39_LY08557 [Lamprigera yunnana]
MSETKHIKLISFGSQKVNDWNSKEVRKTIRISVILPESTEDKCPEFNYKDELVATKKKSAVKNIIPKPSNGLDPFNEDDDDVKRIAAEMEAKYGMGVAKKRKWRKDDYADIGMGYDETDSFIDNTDGYDEIIPKNVTTVHGGFYINCGALEFKTDEAVSSDESSSSEEDATEKHQNHKRVLESSAESEDEVQQETVKLKPTEKKPKLINNTNGMQKAIKKRLFGHEKIKQQIRKKRLEDSTRKTVSELLKEKRMDLNMSATIEPEPSEKIERSVSPRENKKSPMLATIDDVIESVINRTVIKKPEAVDESSKESVSSKGASIAVKTVVTINSSPSEADSNDGLSIKPVELVQLPENLPTDIIIIIDSIKNAAACNTEGKVKFFTDNVNSMLLNLERKCRCLGKQSRMKVYEHLAPFVKCKKETLIKRAKNLCIVEEQKKIKALIHSLKTSIGLMMPVIIENYEEECRSILQRKFSTNNDESTKNLRLPKRHFTWTEELKKLLRDIVTLRRKCYLNEGRLKESLDALLVEFLKSEIQVLWPEGWMSLNSLLKHSNIIDPKKNMDPIKKTIPLSAPEVNINPPPNITVTPTSTLTINRSTTPTISPPPNISIPANCALTITPVVPPPSSVPKVNSIENKVRSKLSVSDTMFSKVNSDISNVSKSSRSLPPMDVKSSSSNVNNIKYSTAVSSPSPIVHTVPKDIETIILDDKSQKKEEPEDLSSHSTIEKHIDNFIKEGLSRNNCQIIDLTDQPEVKKKPSSKPKTKYTYEYSEKIPKLKPEYAEKPPKLKPEIEGLRVKTQEELTGSSAFNQIIADSLNNDVNRFSKSNIVTKSSNSISSTVPISNSTMFDYSKSKISSEGDDIQKVMEGLKVLQKMSSPVKTNDDTRTSSPVSVIAFNKSFSQDANNKTATVSPATNRSNTFQDAFQKQFIPDFMKASFTTTPSKGNYNRYGIANNVHFFITIFHFSYNKINHTSSKSTPSSSEKYLQNNFSQPNSNKVKNNYSAQQSGSYEMLDDMFANFLSDNFKNKFTT